MTCSMSIFESCYITYRDLYNLEDLPHIKANQIIDTWPIQIKLCYLLISFLSMISD